ncbi:lytic polysaccharide monooxygenase [Diplodia corticola]|uniref:Lytic polysaccharide monooxygenase n=1 Tax=Diplodia corticola TaxID=236234 RepID=A0A1J9RB08_9PEZI|nr:lytic polysaccharide monooxygenase [Diplodia corticola]OJD37736.1 lytic polysaccharide monooxygenase [Diplodia corticola]
MRSRTLGFVTLAGTMMVPIVDAHMIMANPVPYGVSTLNNSPLSGDYPCKQRSGVYDVSTMNFMEVGKPQTLSFTGTAVHGGGSCQISVSLDKEPTVSSVFKVVHSIEGDCPGINGGPDTFNFQLPPDFPNGEFALAWTWFNKIGNREMYMNCAPITVTGGADNKDAYDKLPDMQLANIPQTTCKTADSMVPLFPNPGDSVDKRGGGPFVDFQGDCGAPSKLQPVMGGNSDGNSGGSGSSSSQQPPAITSSVPSPSPSSTNMPDASGAAPVTSPAAHPSTPANGAPGPDTPAPAGCGEDGTMVCNGVNQFGICNFGKVIWQDVAAGTKCEDGKITFADKKDRRLIGRSVAGRISYRVAMG